MINDFIIGFFDFFNSIYTTLGVSTVVTGLLSTFSKIMDYSSTFQYYLSGAYYVFGKSLVSFTFTASGLVFVFRFVMAVIYIVGNYVP